MFGIEKQKEQQQIEYESKIEGLKQKLLNKIGDEASSGALNSVGESAGVNQQFTELLSLCRGDLGEILDKLRQKLQSDSVLED